MTSQPCDCQFSLASQTKDLQVVCCAFTAFGKAAIKQKKLHPDTFVQLAMQLAYQRVHKKCGLVKNVSSAFIDT